MRKVLVFQHVSNEILGTLNPLLKERGLRMRYVNFDRYPDVKPCIDKYNGLIVLGGAMGVYEADKYTHIKVEMKIIEDALKKGMPVLGICLGSQILAHVLGANVRKHQEKEIGWYNVHLTEKGQADPLLSHFKKTEKIFQLHGDTFDIPKTAEHLAYSELCQGQAFRYGKNAYGLQFHLEADKAMIQRWLKVPSHQEDLANSGGKFSEAKIVSDTEKYIEHSTKLSQEAFGKFIDLFGIEKRNQLLGSGHGKPQRPGA
jgi:GMP synthase (glutamine-hydrolysing)